MPVGGNDTMLGSSKRNNALKTYLRDPARRRRLQLAVYAVISALTYGEFDQVYGSSSTMAIGGGSKPGVRKPPPGLEAFATLTAG